MNGFKKLLTTSFIAATMLFTGAAAQAMPFETFDHMAPQDRQDYMNYLVESAQKVLVSQGRTDDAATVHKLFNEIHPGSKLPLGEAEFEMNLANDRVRDAERFAQNHGAAPEQVEASLALTLSKHGIQITPDFVKGFVQLASNFKPKFPPLQKKK